MWFLNYDQKSILGSSKNVVFTKLLAGVRYHRQILHNITKLFSKKKLQVDTP